MALSGDASAAPRLVAGHVARPRLFALLDRGAQGAVTVLSGPAGSGKTTLLASWLRERRPAAVAWVGVEREESDAARFWTAVLDALRGSGAVAADDPLATLALAPLGGQEELVERLLAGLAQLAEPVWLVVDDVHQLRSNEARRGLAELLRRAPAPLRVFLLTRRYPRLGLHRLRLAGELQEIRSADLEFTPEEAGELLAGAGVALEDSALALLHQRTEGWAAGLRLAAMSLERQPDHTRFVAEFSGSERTVAEYLLDEVLASQPPPVRRLLLRTCVLARINGELADLLTGARDGAALLAELEESNALVVAVDVGRSWFRCHHLLADLLRRELRREAPQDVAGLHRLAAGWHAAHGDAVEAIRHAELGEDWDLATDLLGRHWARLMLEGQERTVAALLAGLPDQVAERDAELATMAAAHRLAMSRWAEADALLAHAQSTLGALPETRRARAQTVLATVRLLRARRLGDIESAIEDVGDDFGIADPELEALALMNLGIAESWILRLPESEAHLDRGLTLARALARPYVEAGCLSTLGVAAFLAGRTDVAERRCRQAVAIAERAGWSTDPVVAVAYVILGGVMLDRGHAAAAGDWLARAEPILARAPEPGASVGLRHSQGMLAFALERFEAAATLFGEAARLAEQLRAPHFLSRRALLWRLRAKLRLGDLEPARAWLAEAGDAGWDAEWRNIVAHVRLAEGDAGAAGAAVAPVVSGEAFAFHVNIRVEGNMLDAIARARLGDQEGAERGVERVLALTEPHGRVWIVLTVDGAAELLRGHPLHRTAHAAHLKALLDHAGAGAAPPPSEPLSERELAVLRFLPTNLSAAGIGGELFLSVHTIKTHMRKLYAKLGAHTRAEAVERGRALGLLAPPRG